MNNICNKEGTSQNILSFLVAIFFAVVISGGVWINPFIGIGIAIFLALISWAFYHIRSFILIILATKPVIDLTWNLDIINIEGTSINIQGIFAACVFIILGLYILIYERPKIVAPIGWLSAFFLINILSFIFGSKSVSSIGDLMRVLSAMPFLIVGKYLFSDPIQTKRFGVFFLVAMLVPAIVGLLQAIGIIEFGYYTYFEDEKVYRITGGYIHPLAYYKYLYIAIPLIFFLWGKSSKNLYKIFLGLSFLLNTLIIGMLILRMAFFNYFVQCFLWLWLRKKRAISILAFFTVIILIIKIDPATNFILDQVDRIHDAERALNYRVAIWMGYIDYYLDGSPLQKFFGYGPYSDAVAFINQYYSYAKANDAHNDFIRILAENGLLGIITYVGFIASIFIILIKKISIFDPKANSRYEICVFIIFLSYLLMSITSSPVEGVTGFWYLLAMSSPIISK